IPYGRKMKDLGKAIGVHGKISTCKGAVPFGMRDVFARLLVIVGAFRSERKQRECRVVGGANFSVTAEETDERDSVQIHFCFSVLNSRIDSGHKWRSRGSGPGSQVPKVCFFGGHQRKFTGVLFGLREFVL